MPLRYASCSDTWIFNLLQTLQRTFKGLKQQQQQQQQQQQLSAATLANNSSGFRFDHNHNNINVHYSLKRKSTSPSRYHHYPSDEMCEFQAGPSFDLPDREKMRRNGWSTDPPAFGQTNGHGFANRNMIFNATESPIRRSAVKQRIRDELLTDSSVENIRYQAVEGLVQENRQKRLARQVCQVQPMP